jgi:hypothetical protein
MSLEK